MSYATGSANSAAALKTLIEAFATDNGFTLVGETICDTSNEVYIRLAVDSVNFISITGAGNAAFTEKVSVHGAYIYSPVWPVTYELFYYSNPKTIFCVITYNLIYVSWLGFGTVIKPTADSYVGGPWYAAQVNRLKDTAFGCTALTGGREGTAYSSGMPFWLDTSWNGLGSNSYVHAEVDGKIWSNQITPGNADVYCNRFLYPLLSRMPSSWNGEIQLLPARLMYDAAGGYTKDLGQINGLRLTRVDNYLIGEVREEGAEKWKIYPAFTKDTATRDGSGYPYPTTGTFGFALFYDGP